MKLIALVLLSTLVAQTEACLGMVFVVEQRKTWCDQYLTSMNATAYVVQNYFSDGGEFAMRRYSDNSGPDLPPWFNKYDFEDLTESETNSFYCHQTDYIYYSPVLQDVIDLLKTSRHSSNGILLTGSLDIILDAADAIETAKQLADLNFPTFIVDYSQNVTDQQLFKILAHNRTDRIFTASTFTQNDFINFLSKEAIPLFQGLNCGNAPMTVPIFTTKSGSSDTTPSVQPTAPSTNYSCASLELIFILDRSESIVPPIYNGNVTEFVLDLANQFTFPDEATSGSPGYIRLGVIQFSDTPEVTIPLGNYSRSDFTNMVNDNVTIGDQGGINNVKDALMAAYDQFRTLSTLSNRAVVLIVDDISNTSVQDAHDALSKLKTLVNLPMGAIIPGYSGDPAEGFRHLQDLLGNSSYPDLSSALAGIPPQVIQEYPCQAPPACSVLLFVEEATVAIGADAKLSFLKLAQRLVNSVKFTPNQRFGVSFYGNVIYKSIEPQVLSVFNETLSSFIETMSSNNFPNGGRTYMQPILNQLNQTLGSGLYKRYSVLFIAETEGIKDPSSSYTAAKLVSSYNQDIYVIDQSRFTGPSNLFPTLTGDPSRILNGTSFNQDQLFDALSDTLIKRFNSYRC